MNYRSRISELKSGSFEARAVEGHGAGTKTTYLGSWSTRDDAKGSYNHFVKTGVKLHKAIPSKAPDENVLDPSIDDRPIPVGRVVEAAAHVKLSSGLVATLPPLPKKRKWYKLWAK